MFKFSLQPVLDHRQAIEERCQREYSLQLTKWQSLEEQREQLVEELDSHAERIRQGQREGMSYARRQLFESWMTKRRVTLAELEETLEQQAQRVERARHYLIDAARQCKIMDKLREREHGEYRLEEARSEGRAFDEIAVRGFNTRRRREKDAQRRERIAR